MSKFTDYMRATISPAGFFPPHLRDNMALMDGGIMLNNDISKAIEECRKRSVDEKIILDVIMVQEGRLFIY
jgi:predicted acylesterase/phospholipase RssA